MISILLSISKFKLRTLNEEFKYKIRDYLIKIYIYYIKSCYIFLLRINICIIYIYIQLSCCIEIETIEASNSKKILSLAHTYFLHFTIKII